METSIPVVIDTDPGVDDALALALALASPELSVRAVTTVAGNVDLATATSNADYLLRILAPGRAIRVAQGYAKPLVRELVTAEEVHGSDGLAGITSLERWRRPLAAPTRALASAVDMIVDEVGSSPDPVTVIALGPLTNVAAALRRDAAAMRRAAGIVVMGGSLHAGGNVTPHAEFNFYVDPEAADLVLASGMPVTLTPLDVTQQLAVADETVESRLLSRPEPGSAFLGELIRRAPRGAVHRARRKAAAPRSGGGGHPAMAGALLNAAARAHGRHRRRDVRGAMRPAIDGTTSARTATQVAVDVTADALVGRIVDRLLAGSGGQG